MKNRARKRYALLDAGVENMTIAYWMEKRAP